MAAVSGNGRRTVRCKGHRTGTCDNGSVITAELETRALAGIREQLLTPEIIGRFATALQQELAKAARAGSADRDRVKQERDDTRARIAKPVARIEVDDDAPRSLTARLKELEAIEVSLDKALAVVPEPQMIRLPANYEALYRRAIAELDMHLTSEDGAAARKAIRRLIEKIVV